tara:strand:+ start:981 stop:1865 length:885 start_codon:yes stop_codon:yes gene_type:complete
MKRIYLILILCYSCDKIDPNYTQNTTQLPEKTVLIEKFTGHKCSNCPDASRKLEELKEFYGDNLISISIHPGATDFTETDINHPYDFTTSSGDVIMTDMGGTIFGLPVGTVNRISGGMANTKLWLKDDWGTKIDELLFNTNGEPLSKNIEIEIFNSFNEKNKTLTVQTNFTLNTSLEGSHKLCVLIIEDGIIAPQEDGDETIENYEHNHIYRCSVNSVYGEEISKFLLPGVPSSGDFKGQFMYSAEHLIEINTNNNVNWTSDWDNISNCFVVAYIYNTKTLVIEHTEMHPVIND